MKPPRRNPATVRRTQKPVRRVEKKPVRNAKRVEKAPVQKKAAGFGEFDYTFLFLVFLLLAFGLIMLLSASTPAANTKFNNSYHFFLRQLAGAGIGAVGMIFFAAIDYHKLRKYVNLAAVIVAIMLVAVRVPGIGAEANGSWRWLRTPLIRIQPSEFAKPVIAMLFAKMISEKRYRPDNLIGLIPYLCIIGVAGGLMIIEPHLSGAIVICSIGLVVLLVGGAKLRYFVAAGAVVGPIGVLLLHADTVRWGRVLSFLDPFRDVSGKSYQIVQSLIAIGTGGLFGRGLGQSVQKYSFLPEPYNDFIFAIVCEELGFIGALIIILMFAALVIRGIKISFEAPDTYGALMTIGIISHIAIQTAFNIAVVCSAIPNTGIPLPFFSYGGTSIMVLLFEMGMVLNVSRQSTKFRR